MTIDLVHLSELSERWKAGWRIAPGYDIASSDTRATMMSPGHNAIAKNNLREANKSRRALRGPARQLEEAEG